jgi:hypothetical protein
VILAVEVLLVDTPGDLVPGALGQQQPADHGLLGFYRMRRQLGFGHLRFTRQEWKASLRKALDKEKDSSLTGKKKKTSPQMNANTGQ